MREAEFDAVVAEKERGQNIPIEDAPLVPVTRRSTSPQARASAAEAQRQLSRKPQAQAQRLGSPSTGREAPVFRARTHGRSGTRHNRSCINGTIDFDREL